MVVGRLVVVGRRGADVMILQEHGMTHRELDLLVRKRNICVSSFSVLRCLLQATAGLNVYVGVSMRACFLGF